MASFRPHLIHLIIAVWLSTAGYVSAEESTDDPNIVIAPDLYGGLRYRMVGPYRGGRSTAVTGFPRSPHTFLMGTTGGGVWKTEDAGQTWVNISDGHFEVGSIGAVEASLSDPNVLYVGTGSASPRGNVSPGNGIYRSTDGGKTWNHAGLREAGQIGRIRVHPGNPDLVYVAALGHIFGPNPERGVYRSKNGGEAWEQVKSISPRTGAVELVMDPTNPRILYAGFWTVERKPWTFLSGSEEGGVFKSIDGGDSWVKLGGGLPQGLVGRVGLTISPADPQRLWVLIESEEGGVYFSEDGGGTFQRVNKERKLRQRAWYYTRIYADPLDAQTVYALNTRFYKSIDGGKTFDSIPVLHGDCHDLWLNPADPRILIQANDGGAHVSLNGGKSWSTLLNQPTAEMYRVTVDHQFPYRLYGAQQDNSTLSLSSRPVPGFQMRAVGGCESGHIAVDPRDPDIVYAGCYGGSISRTNVSSGRSRNIIVYPQLQLGQAPRNLKYRFQWNAPIRLSPHDPDVLYHASQVVHVSRDQGQSWRDISPDLTRNDVSRQDFAGGPITRDNTGAEVFGTIFALEESPHKRGVLWAGSDDGLVHVSKNGGKSWKNVTPPGLPEWATINMIDLSPHQSGRVFLAAHRYRLDDFAPYIYRSDDSGKNWSLLTDGANGIPSDHFVRVVREDPDRRGLLYAGTEFGLYVSFDDGSHWQSLQLNLPRTPITDLAVHRRDLVVATQGRSFWVLDDLSVLHQVRTDTDRSPFHLFAPRPATRLVSGRSGGPDAAVIHFHLAEKPGDRELILQILDSGDVPVHTYSSKATKAGPRKPLPLRVKKGWNRLDWNLRHRRVDTVSDAVVWGFTGGPWAVPGPYRVRMTLDGTSQSRPLVVRKDPRSPTSQADYIEQFQLAVRIRDRLDRLYDQVRTIRSVRDQIESLASRAAEAGFGDDTAVLGREIVSGLTEIESQLMQTRHESGQDPLNFPPMLDDQIAAVYGRVGRPDAKPTDGASLRLQDLEKQHEALTVALDTLLRDDLERFNRLVRTRKIPRIVPPRRP